MYKFFKNIFEIIFSIWCALSFAIICFFHFILLILLLNFGGKKGYQIAHKVPQICGKWVTACWFVCINTKYHFQVDFSKKYIFVGNHRSMLDAIIAAGYIDFPKKFIGKAEILNWPFLGYLLKKLYIPVQRDQKDSRRRSMQQLLQKIDEPYSIVFFSEGTCNTTSKLLMPFKDGAFRVSVASGIPILPFTIRWSDKLWHRNEWRMRPGNIFLDFYPPIFPEQGNNEENIVRLKDKTFELIEEKLKLDLQKT